MVPESTVTWATSVPILVLSRPLFSRLSSGARYRCNTDGHQTASSLYAQPIRGEGIISIYPKQLCHTFLYLWRVLVHGALLVINLKFLSLLIQNLQPSEVSGKSCARRNAQNRSLVPGAVLALKFKGAWPLGLFMSPTPQKSRHYGLH